MRVSVLRLTLFLTAGLTALAFSYAVLIESALANPGVAPEVSSTAPMHGVDPEVARVRQAIRERSRDAYYNITIVNVPDFVILQGEVDSESHRQTIVTAAASATSKRIRDELRIRPGQSDEQVASRLRDSVSREHPALASKVKIDVRDGIAYVSGDLHSYRQVDQLLATTLMVEGVRDVKSQVTVSGKPYPARHWRVRR